MPIRPVLRMGDPFLLQQTEAVSDFSENFLAPILADMFDTMAHLNGAGLAAPQIGLPWQIVIFGVTDNPRYPDVEPVPTTVLINPRIEIIDDAPIYGWEGCLSVPGMRGKVPRPSKIRYSGLDTKGEPFDRVAEGFHARVVQHEVDHLNGVLYPMRMDDLSEFGFIEELQAAQRLN